MPVHSSMVRWPGDPPAQIERVQSLERGDTCNVSAISMGAHTGTHIDAPLHFIRDRKGIDAMPPDAMVGRARVIEIQDSESVKPVELACHRIRRGERILFKTKNSERVWKTDSFVKDYVFISKAAAVFLAERGIRCVGIDYLSVAGFEHEIEETHRILLEAGIWLIEGLNLEKVEPGKYHLFCLPLRIVGIEAAPARAFLRSTG